MMRDTTLFTALLSEEGKGRGRMRIRMIIYYIPSASYYCILPDEKRDYFTNLMMIMVMRGSFCDALLCV